MTRKTISAIGLGLTIALVFAFFPSMERRASCADCEAANVGGIKKAFEAFYQNCRIQTGDAGRQNNTCFVPGTYNKILPIMKALSKDQRFGIGDRLLLVGETQTDRVAPGANRAFQSVAPLDRDSLNVEVNKIDGSGAIVRICMIDEAGAVKRVGTIKFEETSGTGSRAISLSGTLGKMLRIDITGLGLPLKKFQFTLKAV